MNSFLNRSFAERAGMYTCGVVTGKWLEVKLVRTSKIRGDGLQGNKKFDSSVFLLLVTVMVRQFTQIMHVFYNQLI